jgi:hypothetical protein
MEKKSKSPLIRSDTTDPTHSDVIGPNPDSLHSEVWSETKELRSIRQETRGSKTSVRKIYSIHGRPFVAIQMATETNGASRQVHSKSKLQGSSIKLAGAEKNETQLAREFGQMRCNNFYSQITMLLPPANWWTLPSSNIEKN